ELRRAAPLRRPLDAGVDLDAPARRGEDRETARDVDRDVVSLAPDAEPRVRRGDDRFAETALDRVTVDLRRVEPDLALLEIEAALAEDDLRLAAKEERRSVAGADERARSLRRRDVRADRERRARE